MCSQAVNWTQVAVVKTANFLFPELKYHFHIRDFGEINYVKFAVKEFLKDQDATFFCDGIAILYRPFMKCIYIKSGLYWKKESKNCLISVAPSKWVVDLFGRI